MVLHLSSTIYILSLTEGVEHNTDDDYVETEFGSPDAVVGAFASLI